MARLSGLQREVLSLYRQCLRETRKKPLVRTFLRPVPASQVFLLMIPDSPIGIEKQFQELCQVYCPSPPSVCWCSPS